MGTELGSLVASPMLSSQQQIREVAIILITTDGPEATEQKVTGLHLELGPSSLPGPPGIPS